MSYESQPQQIPSSVPGQAPEFVQATLKGTSLSSMVLGLVSIFLGWTIVVPLVGLILGFLGLKRDPAGKGMAITGLILNGLMILGWALLVLIVVQPWDFSVPPQQ